MTEPRVSASGKRRPASGITIDTGRLAELRSEKNWDQDDLAAKAGLSPSMITKIEKRERRPRASTLGAICDALGCTPADLIPPYPHPFSTPDGNKTYCKRCGYTKKAGNHN